MVDRPVLAYLTSFYPHATDTFIRKEIRALRRQGLTVHPFSVRVPPVEMIVSDDIREERQRTTYLLASVPRLISAFVFLALRRPGKMLAAARLAWRSGGAGIKARIWQAAYLVEAALLAQLLESRGVQHLHNHIGENSATVAMLASLLSGIPFSMTVHGPGDFDHPVAIGLGEKIRRAVFVIGVTEYGRSQLYRWCEHKHWSKIHVVHCGLDEMFLRQPPAPLPSAPRLVCIGRLHEQKGQLLLVDAAAQLAGEGIEFELVFIGDGPLRGEIERLIARHNLQGRVRIAGWMSSEEVRQQLLDSRAMVLASFAEGLPVVIMEALALGRPVISTYVAGIPELVESGVCGWLVPPGSVQALTAAVRQALQAPSRWLEKMGQEGARRVALQHDVNVEAARLVELFARYGTQRASVSSPTGLDQKDADEVTSAAGR